MNNFDLDAKLKSVPLPERTEEYWDDFPSQVRVQLRRSHPEFASRLAWWPRLAWAGGLALTMVLVCLQFHPLQPVSLAVVKKEQHLRKQLAQLDAGLHVLMFNLHGMGYLLAEAN
jgi:hypothetical protein